MDVVFKAKHKLGTIINRVKIKYYNDRKYVDSRSLFSESSFFVSSSFYFLPFSFIKPPLGAYTLSRGKATTMKRQIMLLLSLRRR